MNTIVIRGIAVSLLFFAVCTFGQSRGTTTKSDTVIEELTRISIEIYDAGRTGNRGVIEKYFADTYLEVDAMGVLRDKKWNLENFAASNVKITHKIEEPQVREYGNFAILYYRWSLKFEVVADVDKNTTPNVSFPKLRVIDTFLKTDNGWKLVSSSRVRIPQSAGDNTK